MQYHCSECGATSEEKSNSSKDTFYDELDKFLVKFVSTI